MVEVVDFYYWYWAHTLTGKELHFADNNHYEIGSTIDYEGESVIIDDYAVEPIFK